MTLSDRVMSYVQTSPGKTDREIAEALFGVGHPQQGVNQVAPSLARRGLIQRERREDALTANYPASQMTGTRKPRTRQPSEDDNGLGEEQPLDRETTPAGQVHDQYGKQVLRAAAGDAFVEWGPQVEVDYGAGRPARIDGAVGGQVAVEVEARVPKQIRGAVLDLIFHSFPLKLLVLMRAQLSNPEATASQCRNALGRFVKPACFRVILLDGDGHAPRLESDADLAARSLRELGVELEL